MSPGGYFGRALVVDVAAPATRERARARPSTMLRAMPRRRRARHLAACTGSPRPAWTRSPPEAPLAFVFSPLVGTPLTTSAKFAVVAKSPLTGLLNDALASSHFAIAGQADRPRRDRRARRAARSHRSLLVDGDGARLEPARRLWRAVRGRGRGSGCASGSGRPGASRRSARRASAWSATRPCRTTAATPAAAGSARCSAPSA